MRFHKGFFSETMSHYAEHPSDANEYELEIALREVRRLRRVRRWRGDGR